jgi:hypothetical protein
VHEIVVAVLGLADHEFRPEVFELVDAAHEAELFFVKVALQFHHFFDDLFVGEDGGFEVIVAVGFGVLEVASGEDGETVDHLPPDGFDLLGLETAVALLAPILDWFGGLFLHGFAEVFMEQSAHEGHDLEDGILKMLIEVVILCVADASHLSDGCVILQILL